MKQFPFLVCLAFLLLLVLGGIASADSLTNTTTPTATITVTTTTPELTGGSISFETNPRGAMIWLDNIEVATSPITHYSQKTGTLDVLIRKKGYEDYRDNVTVVAGQRVMFTAVLKPLSYDISGEYITPEPVATATTAKRSTMTIPTSWPTSPQASPVDPAVGIGAVALGIGFFVIRRR